MKRLFYPPPIRELFLVLSLLLVGNQLVFAEGSKDFWDYDGFRLFYLISPAANGSVTNEQQMKVYGAAGEFINVGSSHVGIQGGFILVYRPDGTLHSTFNGNDGSAIINNDVEELAGPTGGGTTNGTGYNPGVIQVQAGEEGIWTVVLDYPPANYTAASFPNLMNGESWTRAANQPTTGRVALAWDITISQSAAGNTGGTFVEGRVYSNEYISIVSENGNPTSPSFFVLTRSGFLYQIDFDRADPWGFPLFSNSKGIVTGDQAATYQSFDRADYSRSANIANWDAASNYLYHPQAEDSGLLWNNKIFFNAPDANMPNTAIVTDIINGNNTHNTWLYTEVAAQNIGENPFGFAGDVPAGGACEPTLTMQEGQGGSFVYSSQVGGVGQLKLDLDNNGSFNDPIDRIIESEAILGEGNSIFWDGRDGLGNVIPANPNFQFNYDLTIRGGEVHILMDDVENNIGGVAFTRLNGVNSPSNIYYYDHSQTELEDVSGGGAAGNALPTVDLYTYGDGLGNDKLLDFYTFIEASNFGNGAIAIEVASDCSAPVAPVADNDGDGIADEDDLDDDNDGISDIAEGGITTDTDGDGVPDYLDLDSDNDGIYDVIEAGHGQVDANQDGIIDGANFGANGLYNPLASSADDLNAVITYTPADTDGDGIADWRDLDSDNDGIYDVRENNNLDQDNDGIIGSGSPIVNASGIATASANGAGITINLNLVNTDGTGGADYIDLDSDGDGRLDIAEAGLIDGDGDGILGTGTPTINGNGVPSTLDSNGNTITATSNPRDSNNDGIPDFQEVFVAPTVIRGCTDVTALNYNATATEDDGSCQFVVVPPVFVCDATTTPTLSPTRGGAGAYCLGSAAALSVSGTTGFTGPVNFTWTGPNGFTETGRLNNANTVYQILVSNLAANSAGTYSLVLTTDEGCVSAPANLAISVDQGPSAGIQNNTGGTICGGGAASLSASPAGAGITYEWFRDGVSQGTTNDPSFAAASSGSYTVVASQGGCAGASSSAVAIAIGGAGPNASIQNNTTGTICDGSGASLSASPAGAGITYEWFRDGISQGTTNDPSFSASNTGSYTVIASQGGCPGVSSSAVAVVIGGVGPNASIQNNTGGTICGGGAASLSASPAGAGITYEWFRDGVSQGTTNDPSFAAASSGSYTVVASQGGCAGVSSPAVAVSIAGAGPNASIQSSGSGVACSGESVQLSASPTGAGITYEWFRDGISQGTTTDPTFSASTGSYTVIASQDGCPGASSPAVAVSVSAAGPNASIQSSASGDLCSGEVVTFTASPAGAGISYEWFKDGVSQGTTGDPNFSIGAVSSASSGQYSVVASQNGCPGASSALVTINVLMTNQVASNIIIDNPLLCEGMDFEINATPAGDGAFYTWFLNGAPFASGFEPFIIVRNVTIANTGDYSVQVDQAGCNSVESSSVAVTVFPSVSASLSANGSSICGGESLTLTATASAPDVTYDWYRDGNLITSTTDPNLQANTSGTYTVVTRQDRCESDPSNPVAISVADTPAAGSISAANASLCPGESVALSASDLEEGVTYNWYLNGNLISSTTDPTYAVGAAATTAGTYTMIPSIGTCEGPSSNSLTISVGENAATPVIEADKSSLCSGENLRLTVSGVGGTPNYEWFRDGASLGATSDPFFATSGPGSYTVAVSDAQCGGGTSNVLVVTESAAPEAGVIMTEDADLCEGDNLNLTATDLGDGVSYNWYRDGNLVSTTDVPSFSIAGAAGSYTMIPSVNICEGPASSAIAVTVAAAASAPTITANNAALCPGEGAVLTANGVGGPASYEWFLEGVSVQTTDEPILTLENASAGNYTVTASGGDCGGGTSEPFALNVAPTPDESAMIMEIPTVACGEATTTLEANVPAEGTGTWSSTDPDVVFADPSSATTTVSGITGGSMVTWSLSNDCGVYASDALTINVTAGTATAADDNFTVGYNLALEAGNIVVNDAAEGDNEIRIISQPANGTASIVGGALQYMPNENFSGTDRVEYEICSNICPEQVCASAFANIVVDNPPNCVIPSVIADVITPNSDGLNDVFMVQCTDSKDIGMKIFNRWGDKVFEDDRYQSNWAGTHDGEPLPPGPYYYILTEPGAEKRTGCIAISR